METHRRVTWLLGCLCALLLCGGTARATDICGAIPATLTITENSQLVCDVVCTQQAGPCIQFGAPNIWLRLNGFKMTGQADPPANCVATNNFLPEDGISTNNQDNVAILGPGLVERFRRHGMFLVNGTKLEVKHVTSHHNCFSGLQMVNVTDSDIEENVSVRNASASGPFPCGGNCISNSHNNRIRRNEFSGNGSIAPGPPGALPNDFGVGLVGNSSGNVIEENGIGGNINGVRVAPTAVNNLIRRNVIAGNPPVQVSASFGAAIGVDIRDFSPPGANTFEENLCITYTGATTPPPCPNIPKFAGHKNTSQSSSRNNASPSSSRDDNSQNSPRAP
ncbi:MAG: right-handed parallel beta-helix repeat-containing protein [Acidobacteria bacterium]|nr:right-handed parallel beta-helix repeat-containing protein [Acidobacteriota bacterium]